MRYKGIINHISPPRDNDPLIDLGVIDAPKAAQAAEQFHGVAVEQGHHGTVRVERAV